MSERTRMVAVLVGGVVLCLGGILSDPAAADEQVSRYRTAETRIFAALEESTSVELIEQPLAEYVDFIRDCHKIEVQIDRRALEEVGIDVDEPITKRLEGVSLCSALNLILRDLGLDWTIANEVLLITSPDEAKANLVARVYDVGKLIEVRDADGKIWKDFDSMIHLLTSTVQPESWESVGGPGTIAAFELRGAAGLVIRHTPKVHQEVNRLLFELDKLAYKQGDDVYPTREPAGDFGMGGMGGMDEMDMGMGSMGSGFGPAPPASSPSETAKQK